MRRVTRGERRILSEFVATDPVLYWIDAAEDWLKTLRREEPLRDPVINRFLATSQVAEAIKHCLQKARQSAEESGDDGK